jgi:hypothetical protein
MWVVIEKKKRALGVRNTKKGLSLDFTDGKEAFFLQG